MNNISYMKPPITLAFPLLCQIASCRARGRVYFGLTTPQQATPLLTAAAASHTNASLAVSDAAGTSAAAQPAGQHTSVLPTNGESNVTTEGLHIDQQTHARAVSAELQKILSRCNISTQDLTMHVLHPGLQHMIDSPEHADVRQLLQVQRDGC